MKLKTIILVLATVLTTSFTSAANKTPLPLAEYMVLLSVNGQVFSKMDYERKQFIKNDRPYTFDEDTDYSCNALIVAKENIKFTKKYPEYKHVVQVQNYIKLNQNLITRVEQGLVKENRKCKGYIVRMPITTKGSIPLIMTDNEANKNYNEYYAKREQIVEKYKNSVDISSRKKQICELKNLSVTTEMSILMYSSMARSEEGQKVLAMIKNDGDFMRTKLNMDERCGM